MIRNQSRGDWLAKLLLEIKKIRERCALYHCLSCIFVQIKLFAPLLMKFIVRCTHRLCICFFTGASFFFICIMNLKSISSQLCNFEITFEQSLGTLYTNYMLLLMLVTGSDPEVASVEEVK